MKKFRNLLVLFICSFVFPIYLNAVPISSAGSYSTDLNVNGEKININKYVTDSGQPAVCLNPGKAGPGGADHQVNVDIDVSNCANGRTNKDGSTNVACGLLLIQQQAYELQKAGVLSADDAALAVTLASRMWASNKVAEQFGDNSFNYDIDSSSNWENPDSSSAVKQSFNNTAAAIMNAIWAQDNGTYSGSVTDYVKNSANVMKDSAGITDVAVNLFVDAFRGEVSIKTTDFSTDNAISNREDGSSVLDISSNLGAGNLIGITDSNGNQLPTSTGTCADGSGECLQLDLDALCSGKKPGEEFTVKIRYYSDDTIDNIKLYKNIEDPAHQNFSVNAIPEYKNQEKERVETYKCPIEVPKCEENPETGICYGPEGEELENCDLMEELCSCIVKDGICLVGGEEVECAPTEEENEYPDSQCFCYYDPDDDKCKVGDTEVDCEKYPGCKGVCEVENGNCFVNGVQVECEDYPECSCERVGDTCFIGDEIVDCEDYPDVCPTCEKIGDTCYIGDNPVDCGSHDDCPKDGDTPNGCPVNKIDNVPYDTCKNGNTEGELADPPMCSILKNNIKAAYEIEDYGDSKYCDVYCRETYTFRFMDKETVQSGRYFRHDVTKKYVPISNLSTVITATQQCTSLIDYDKWKEDYMAANSSVRNAFNTVKYWESLYNLNGGQPTQIIDCGGGARGCDNCNWEDACGDWQLIWRTGHYAKTDSFGVPNQTPASESPSGESASCPRTVYSCDERNSEGECVSESYECVGTNRGPAKTVQQARGIDRDYVVKQHNSAVNAYKSALNKRNDLINRLFNCNLFDPSEVSKYFSDPGSYFVSMYAGNHSASPNVVSRTYGNIINNYEPNSELKDLSYDEQPRLNEEGSASNVKFDKLMSDDRVVENKGYKTSAQSNDPYDNSVCGGCSETFESGLSSAPATDPEFGALDGREFGFWVCDGSLTGAHCTDESSRLKLPKNYVANMEVTREIGFWQSTQFSTEIFTGKVVNGSGGLQLPEKSWPVAISTLTGDYNIYLDFYKFGDSKRKNGTLKLEFRDEVNCAYAVVNETTKYDCDDGYHECYDCDDPSTPQNECYPNGETPSDTNLDLGFYFRSIDLKDIFPNSVYSPNKTSLNPTRPIGSNWTTGNAIQAIKKIQDLENHGEGIWKQTPEYSVTLTPSMRKAIAKNNREIYKGDYLSYNTCTTLNCSSKWLQTDLRNILNDYNHGEYYVQNDNSRNNLYRR